MKPNTITLPKRLLDAASTETTRTMLHGALVDAEHRCVVVCNGRCLAIHPIPGDATIKPGYITPAKWKSAKANNSKEMILDFVAGTINGEALDAPDVNGNYPAYRQVIPEFKPCYRTVLKPPLIAAIANALGYTDGNLDGLVFEFDSSEKSPVRITYKDTQAVLMPMGGRGEGGLLVADGESIADLNKEIAQLKAALSERSDISSGTDSEDAALIETLKTALHETRARVSQLEAYIDANPHGTAPRQPVKPLDAKPAGKASPHAPKAKREKTVVLPATERPTVTRNAARDGIELRFNGKPDDATRLAMKKRGWRWLPSQPGQPWAVKYHEEEWIFAQSLATGSPFTPMPDTEPTAQEPVTPQSCDMASATPEAVISSSRVRRITLPDF